ncbi:MAG: NADH:ubiquinone reductase (Na(+)-transporting) subunit C [Rikenellaceae bacterium]|nr:NADH:ubiquinone reductase (Na(+)-transporting) subunit C [Rikenellaceae bacterium]MCL2692042.1 NADH:ubiquinone reductase (Na(+)-transporting) subunit C [Rikenellaceae bacterium]
MNRNSNTYIVVYATAMVVIVALALSFASLALRDRQQANIENEMKRAILRSIGIEAQGGMAAVDALYARYIVGSFAVDARGEVVEGANAFELLANLRAVYALPPDERELPVFVSRDGQGVERYIIPLWGSGLWGPIWGYLALESDWKTVSGAVFYHQGETPGLGAEIAESWFGDRFAGKTIFRDGQFVSVSVEKRRGTEPPGPHSVDAITGGTITAFAVGRMIRESLQGYLPFIQLQKENE